MCLLWTLYLLPSLSWFLDVEAVQLLGCMCHTLNSLSGWSNWWLQCTCSSDGRLACWSMIYVWQIWVITLACEPVGEVIIFCLLALELLLVPFGIMGYHDGLIVRSLTVFASRLRRSSRLWALAHSEFTGHPLDWIADTARESNSRCIYLMGSLRRSESLLLVRAWFVWLFWISELVDSRALLLSSLFLGPILWKHLLSIIRQLVFPLLSWTIWVSCWAVRF